MLIVTPTEAFSERFTFGTTTKGNRGLMDDWVNVIVPTGNMLFNLINQRKQRFNG